MTDFNFSFIQFYGMEIKKFLDNFERTVSIKLLTSVLTKTRNSSQISIHLRAEHKDTLT